MLVRSRSRNPWAVSSRRRLGDPLLYAQQYGLLLWLRADMGVQYGATLRATGTTPPAWTISGTATRLVGLHLEIDSVAGGTGLGQATYKWSEDNGATYQATGVPTAAGPTALGTTGLSVSMAAGPYNIDNKYDITVAQWNDQSGNGNHAVMITAANQPQFSLTGFGGYSAVDYKATGTYGLATPALTFGYHTMIAALRGDASSAFFLRHYDGAANKGHLYSATGDSSMVTRASVTGRDVSATWVRDGVRKTVGKTFAGTHASHRIYINGLDQNAATGSASGDPGSATITGAVYVGNYEGLNSGLRGVLREVVIFNSSVPPSVMLALHYGMAARASGAI